jgi:hypothetical protein
MRSKGIFHSVIGLIGLVAMVQPCSVRTARADIISSTPTLPVLNTAYLPSSGAGCFPVAGVCIDLGSLTLTSVVSSTFNSAGQDIVADAVFAGQLTTIMGTPIGPISLSGTVEQEVVGRTTSTELGSWETDLLDLDLRGPVLGHTLMVGLDGSHTSSGLSAIEPAGNNKDGFRISSFFDIFVELELDSVPPLSATRGPITVALIPEPIGLLVLVPALLALAAFRRRD